jgi:hypothetical protein
MRQLVRLFSTMGLALLIVSGTALAQTAPGEVPDASCQPTTSGPPHLLAFFRSSAKAAQTFTAEHTGLLSSAQVQVGDFENEPTGIVMEIRTVDSSGTPLGVVLASTQIPASEVPYGLFGVATGHFSPGAPVEAGQQYAIALRTSTGVQIRGVIWAGDESIPCPGELYQSSDSAPEVFQAVGPGFDGFFSTFVTLRTAPQTKADCKKGDYKELGFKNQGQCIKAVNHAGS